jgi:hypothetical protein
MNDLMWVINRYFAFLHRNFGARVVDERTGSMGCATVILELGDLRMAFVNDRGPISLEFQSIHHDPKEDTQATIEGIQVPSVDGWFSLDVVRQLITGVVDDKGVLWGWLEGNEAEYRGRASEISAFVRDRMGDIQSAFSNTQVLATEGKLNEYCEARARRLFG